MKKKTERTLKNFISKNKMSKIHLLKIRGGDTDPHPLPDPVCSLNE